MASQKVEKSKIKVGEDHVDSKTYEKIVQAAQFELKQELFRQIVRKDYKCEKCEELPRPENRRFFVCSGSYCQYAARCEKCSCDCNYRYKRGLPNELFEHFPFQCKNTKYGCENILMPAELGDHETYCDYQKVNCPNLNCKADISFLNLLDHFDQNHSDCEVFGNAANNTFKLPFEVTAEKGNTIFNRHSFCFFFLST